MIYHQLVFHYQGLQNHFISSYIHPTSSQRKYFHYTPKNYFRNIEPRVEGHLLNCLLITNKNQSGCIVTGIGFNTLPRDKKNNTAIDTSMISNQFKYYLKLNSGLNGYFSKMTNDIIMPSTYQTELIDNYFRRDFFDKNCKIMKLVNSYINFLFVFCIIYLQ